MANPYVTGAVDLYIHPGFGVQTSGYGGGMLDLLTYPDPSGIYYLGSCEKYPRILINPKWKHLLSDLNGGDIPFDVSSSISDAAIMLTLTIWNESVYKMYSTTPVAINGVRGFWAAGDVGRLMLHEGIATCLWCYFPYSPLKQYGGTYHQPNGYRFVATWVTGEEILSGSQLSKRMIQIYAIPVYNPTNGTWTLLDHTMTSIPTIPPYNPAGVLT